MLGVVHLIDCRECQDIGDLEELGQSMEEVYHEIGYEPKINEGEKKYCIGREGLYHSDYLSQVKRSLMFSVSQYHWEYPLVNY